MKQIILTLIILMTTFSSFAQKEWQKKGVKFPAPICYGSGEVHENFVDAPDQYLKRLKSNQQKKSSIIVDYIGFSAAPKAAFQYAVEIWEHLVASPVPIYLRARWTADLQEGVLGSCGPYIFFENFDSAPYKDRYYPVALVEKLEGEEITDESVPDIIAQFNSDIDSWYFGTDGNTPRGEYDFVSVVLHEIGHGLGFTGFFYEQGGLGTYGDVLPYPGIFDEFVINGSGQQLIDTSEFANPSAALYEQMRSNNLYFKSQTVKSNNPSDSYPRLYAPSSFDEGSSIYHLNEFTYNVGDTNSLMTPFFDKAEAIHDPGPLMLAIFSDMGWDYTSIIHSPIPDTETATIIPIEATIETDSEIDSTSVAMVISADSFLTSDTIDLFYSADQDHFVANLIPQFVGTYQYYLMINDSSEKTFYLPGQAPAEYFEFTIGPDLLNPEVTHDPVSSILESDLTIEVAAEATDNIGISSVVMQYIINEGSPETLILEDQDENLYKSTLSLTGLTDGDSIRYQIIATDSSSNNNRTTLPGEGEYYTIHIDGLQDPVKTYTNDFNSDSRDFISSDFYIGIEDLFDDGALHSPHPYPSPDEDDTEYNFTALLKYPIIIDDRAMISFNEVVLVEPAEKGSEFGDSDFWDYVIVEGSKTGNSNWQPLIDGYDSRANATWEMNYNNNQVGNNSSAQGKATYYINREFKMTENGNFAEGDTLFIRFRLFSDPYANGWGWAIDDLRIQDPPTADDELTFSPGEVMIYPNPVTSKLYINGSFKSKVGQLKIAIFNSNGQQIRLDVINQASNQLQQTIDAENLKKGLYLLSFQFENGQIITKKFVK
ncbi:T9SS type A sorting domain-containing protein [uncultured Sunxiuqinia sp.]|uniref:T9SS type A sorting domain-containing protein n=1 Tax=uncultured Sunxiuqinia sp. TaxID=1573825 RepID=UPI002AA84A82|nr:T9SS type A sorting domain-containing protein [uncultured Sunxiuqinia sp.]